MTDEQDQRKGPPPAGTPITTTRFPALRSRRTPPSKREDELTVAIAEREKRIEQLLRREFGTLAPPPPPDILRPSPRNEAAARIRQDEIESRRKEYEAVDAASLQSLVDEVEAEDARRVQEWVAKVQAEREQRWPRWAAKDLWSETEFAALCCGLVPDERGMPGDPGKVAGDDSQAVAINRAADDIRRGTLSKTLTFVPRDDADTAAIMYGTARHYVPAVAAEWAAARFNSFPASVLAAVRERTQAAPEPATPASGWPWGDHETDLLRKLAAAADRFWKLYDPTDATTAPTNQTVVDWLKGKGVSEKVAQSMATILRADGLPTGPRK